MYSTKQLDGKTKSVLVNLVMQMQEENQAYKEAPTTPAAVTAVMLNIEKELTLSQERSALAKQAHLQKMAEIKAASAKEIKKLELEFTANENIDSKAIVESMKAIEDKIAASKEDLTFGLAKAQNEADVKLEKIKEALSKEEKKASDLIDGFNEAVSKGRANSNDTINNIKSSHVRTVEEIEYDQKIALRDLDKDFIDSVCEKLDLTTISKEELKSYKDFQATDDKKINDAITAAVTTAKAAVHATEGAKYSKLKAEADMIIAIDKNNIVNLEANLKTSVSRSQELEARLKEVPSQLAEAVKAAQSNVSVTQESLKK